MLRLTYAEGLGIRAIGRRLKMARKTVRKLLDGDRASKRDKPALPRARLLLPFEGAIRQMLGEAPEMRAPAMLERLRTLGYRGGITILRDRLLAFRPHAEREPFLTLEFPVGAAAQVDWADFGFALPGCPRRVSAFVMVLCYSRYLYLEFTLSQAMGSFLRCMERALRLLRRRHQGRHLRQHEDRGEVAHADGHRVQRRRFLEYARARQFGAVACNVARGNEKGIVERPIGFVRERFWPGCRPSDLMDLNVKAVAWRDTFANNRVHDVTGKVPALVFEHEERRVLRGRYRTGPSTPTTSTPPPSARPSGSASIAICTPCRRAWWTRPSSSAPHDHNVSVFLGPKHVATHSRCWDTNKDVEDPAHREIALARKPRAKGGELPPALLVSAPSASSTSRSSLPGLARSRARSCG